MLVLRWLGTRGEFLRIFEDLGGWFECLMPLIVVKVVLLYRALFRSHLNHTTLRRRNHKSHSLFFHTRELDLLPHRQPYDRELLQESNDRICGFGERKILWKTNSVCIFAMIL